MSENKIRDRIVEHIKKAGFELAKDLHYYDGLPGEREAEVEPEFKFGDGISAVVVTATYAQQWFRPCPYAYTSWGPRGPRIEYSTPEELTQALTKLCKKPKGCWD